MSQLELLASDARILHCFPHSMHLQVSLQVPLKFKMHVIVAVI